MIKGFRPEFAPLSSAILDFVEKRLHKILRPAWTRWRIKKQRYSEAAQRRREERLAFREEQKDAELAYYLNRFQEEQKAAQAEKRGSGAPGRER